MAQSPEPMATELQPQQSPPTSGLKRRNSSATEQQEGKRPRTSPEKASPKPYTPRDEQQPANNEPQQRRRESTTDKAPEAARRKPAAVNEKDRSRRLFGGLLGSLSQKGDSRTAKRRQEIESRKKAELQRQDEEHEEDRQRRLERLGEKRRRVRRTVDEETMRNRHSNMLDSAHFLHTTAQPRLLYKPWELRPEEEDRIDDQISRAQEQIDRELEDAQSRRDEDSGMARDGSVKPTSAPEGERDEQRLDPNTATTESEKAPLPNTDGDTTARSSAEDADGASSKAKDATKTATPPAQNDDGPRDGGSEETETKVTSNHDEHDDHVVEGEEDTVIY